MNYTKCILLVCLLQPILLFAQLGGSCGSPYIIPLDGVARNYTASSTTDGSVVCTNGSYPTKSPVTWFSITTNAAAEMPLLDITAADSSSCEIAMYTACNGGSILQAPSSMCFDDGWGLWSPSQTYNLLANTTYYLRIKTQSATQLKIAGQSNTPTNGNCAGATPVDQVNIHDNNATNKPSGEVTPLQLCAYTLENTAFYQFYIATSGVAIINISSIACDNGNNNNDNGIQIGFFTGSCGGLVPLNCAAGLGPFVQATTPVLAAGTKVYVAIDGNAGSNCQYELQALNALKVLSADEFKNFSAWKTSSSNILKWTGNKNINSSYQIERSENGSDFTSIGQIYTGSEIKETDYQFEDRFPITQAFYRIKRTDKSGRVALSNTIKVNREITAGLRLRLVNPVLNNLNLEIESGTGGPLNYAITSTYGQMHFKGTMQLIKGVNKLTKDLSNLPKGQYIISAISNENRVNAAFIKIQ